MNEFALDSRLKADTEFLFDWPLCRVLLMNDLNYPWCILVPRVRNEHGEVITELYHLDASQRAQLDKESMLLAETMMHEFSGAKMNIAALGNVVSQLHVHHVVRYQNDAAWPAPVWGKLNAKPYDEEQLFQMKQRLVDRLKTAFDPL